MSFRIPAILCILIGLTAPPVWGEAARPVVFLPQWLPQAQFAGYYMAYEKGIYKRHGIDLTILRGGPEQPPSTLLTRGKAHFTTMFLSNAIELRSRGVPLVNIGQIVQRSGFILVTRKASGIKSPTDLNGKKVSLWNEFSLQPKAFFRKYGVEVKTVPQGTTLNLFLRGGVSAASAMWYNEFHTLLNSGLDEEELVPFFFNQHDLNFPEDGIYCLEETYRQDPDLACRFLRASLEGWRYAFAYPEETLDVVMKYIREANVGSNRVHQKWMLTRMNDLILPPGSRTEQGHLHPEDYLRVAGELQRSGIIRTIPPYGAFYANCLGRP
ncbi:MAG: ABC transporter substrate-binding protein [Desulfuromonadales bacterium]|nr:ABC transporter substrate-binding protein [Desulfuromonadales bacterium]